MRKDCGECNPSILCKSDWICTTLGNKKYDGFCARCFHYIFPDDERTRAGKALIKVKETAVGKVLRAIPCVTFVDEQVFLDYTCVSGGVGPDKRSYPDFVIEIKHLAGTNAIAITECDEGNGHKDRNTSCEVSRMTRGFETLAIELGPDQRLIWIRFNPDSRTIDGVLEKSTQAERHADLRDLICDEDHPVFAGPSGSMRIVFVNYDEVDGEAVVAGHPAFAPIRDIIVPRVKNPT